MVGDEAQLYTIEGFAAAILIVVTAYLILNSTFILTPGDTHINDLQLEQLGNDVLRMMDTRDSFDATAPTQYLQKQSYLEQWLSSVDRRAGFNSFATKFQDYAVDPNLKFSATMYYWDHGVDMMESYVLSPPTQSTGREHYVTVTRYVYLDNPGWDPLGESRTVLLEVQLWRD